MRVLLISANMEQISLPALPLGLAAVAAATQDAGHEVVLSDLMFEEDPRPVLEKAFEAFSPEVIGVSVRNIDDQVMTPARFLLDQAKDVVAVCRSLSDAPIVLGGAGYTIFPESALEYVGADMGIQGEGEVAFPALLEALANKAGLSGLPGLFRRGESRGRDTAFTEDLEALPLPSIPLLTPSALKVEEPWIPVQSRRGCPLKCSYCSTPKIEGSRIRHYDPLAVADWMARWVEQGFKHFFFVDNTFNLPQSYAKALCRAIIARELDAMWLAIIYPRDIDEELAGLMAQAGCKQVSLGFESGCSRILKNLNKDFTLDEVREVSALFERHGIQRWAFLMFGGPGETRESVQESLDFTDSLHPDQLKMTMGIRIYPDTPLAQTALDEGLIASESELLEPRFYFAKGLEEWLPGFLEEWKAGRTYPVL